MHTYLGCGCGRVVSELTLYSNDPSSNPAYAYRLYPIPDTMVGVEVRRLI